MCFSSEAGGFSGQKSLKKHSGEDLQHIQGLGLMFLAAAKNLSELQEMAADFPVMCKPVPS